jgi:ribosomal protein S18 acetylase RimI-like enzyme
MMAALARSPEVDDVYVGPAATGARAALLAAGWRSAGMQTQLVVQRAGWSGGAADDVRELGVADLPEFRRTLARATGADDRLLTASYGDDFFERAHPAWLFGKFDGAWLVGTVGMRLQQRSAMVFALGVDDSDRSRGVARDLVRAAVSQAFAAGATFVHALAEPAGLRVGLAAGASVVGSWEQFERP